ncbi:3'(2'),5'-bisphosphate nucleotidase CysQ [Ensifer soli]|uniref:3'(2'),5'-bisphosphate nucleotidase CysQ n=1 Tax=Ciceribacter sp. sgz301302 TaxID=3342379 RepID=UPI0035B89082
MQGLLEAMAVDAGRAILDIYRAGASVSYKPDCSPVTDADEAAEAIILAGLSHHFGTIPVVAEEQAAAGILPDIDGGRFFLVDPLDGTKEFINRRDEFTVNIALIEAGAPVAGVVYAPALGVLYSAEKGLARKQVVAADFSRSDPVLIGCRNAGDRLVAIASRSHNCSETLAYLADHGITDFEAIGSSLKFCLLAEGIADVYPRFGRTMEWDTAAGDAILRAAGGETLTLAGEPLTYGKRHQQNDSEFANPPFVSRGRR